MNAGWGACVAARCDVCVVMEGNEFLSDCFKFFFSDRCVTKKIEEASGPVVVFNL
jgi:hypothetical protein